MFQSAGPWPVGWKRLLPFWANCQSFPDRASALPKRVHDGQALVATSIDYYAFSEIATAGPNELKFVLPEDGVIFTPDPISVLKGAPHLEMARRFVQFVLSVDGQALWCLPAGTPGGPVNKTLFRQPINRVAYEKYARQFPPQLVNIFALNSQVILDEKLQSARIPQVLPLLMKAAAIDNGANLRQAWKRIIDKGCPPELMEEFLRLPENLATEEAIYRTAAQLSQGDAQKIEEISNAWTDFFRAKYERIR
jgi:spermidine/putrescine-binding protein